MKDELFADLKKAVQEYDKKGAALLAKKTVEQNIDPMEVIDMLTVAIRETGEKFSAGELFLPELIGAAEAMSASTAILEEAIKKSGKKRKRGSSVVIGTVYGDIHDIGKNMVATLLKASGYHVVDCGVNVQAESFIKTIAEENPEILALSALLTTTAPEQDKVIKVLKERGLREKIKVIVGGGGITRQFAEKIGADGYDATASGAVTLANRLLNIQ